MSEIIHKRILGERVDALIKKRDPDIGDLVGIADALAEVMSDVIGAPCKIQCRVNADALEKAMFRREA
jgi:hypothetical protein